MAPPGFWVFGYGSLMWSPGFDFLERREAVLTGFRRAFALESVHYRGTPDRPGLVLGLDWAPGHQCTGVAFRVCPTRDADVRSYLHERELVSYAYFEVVYPVRMITPSEDGAHRVDALCYVLDRSHRQYRGDLSLERQADIIAHAAGPRGTNADYLHATVAHLRACGIEDAELTRLDGMVSARLADGR